MNILRSFTETVVTTPTDTFPISFEYDEKYDAVHVFLNDVAVEDLGYTVSQVNAVTLKVEPAIPDGTVRIERETDIDKMKYIFDAGALFIDQNVDADFKQIVHSQQEVRDGFIKLRGDVLPLVHGLQEALEQAQEASQSAQEAAEAAAEAAQVTRLTTQVDHLNGETQQQINDYNGATWYSKVGGYQVNDKARLSTGEVVISTIPSNTNNPNVNMAGWSKVTVFRVESISDLLAISNPITGYTADVNGGGRFSYDATKSALNDGVVTFNGWVRQLDDNTITSEMVGIVSGEDATAKLDVLAAFMNGKSYNLKLNGSISTTKALVLLNLSNSKIEFDDLYFVPPATTTLSQNRGAITVRNSTNVTVRNSYLHGECVMYSADLEDGQAGIVFIDSTNCKAYNNRIERFHTWGILASNCSNTLAFNNTINHITRQSGINIWHGNGANNVAFGNTITNIGLYGVEFENGTGLNDKGFSKSNIISDCFQGVTLVNLIDNATIVDHEINRCYRGITYSLSVGTRKLKIADNKVNDCRIGMLHGIANVQSSRNTFIYSAQSFYKTSPYSSVDYFDANGYVYVVDSVGKTNATTWTVGDSVQINGVTHTITEVVTGVTVSPYTFNFVKIKFSVNPTNLRVGDFILKPPVIDNVGVHFFSTAYIESQLDVIQGYAIHYKESMTTTGNRRIKSPHIVDGTTVFRFDNSLSNLNCKFYVDDMQITGDAQLVDNAHANSLASIRYLVSNGYVRPNGYYNLNYFKPVTYGSFSLITQGRRTLKAMRFIAVELEYIGLATSTGNPALLINDQNFELSLGKVATTTPTDGVGFTVVNPFNAVGYLNIFKLTNTSSANDLGYTSLQYKLFYI